LRDLRLSRQFFIVVDGVGYQLAGQPPMAQAGSWGDLGWLLWGRRRAGVTQVTL